MVLNLSQLVLSLSLCVCVCVCVMGGGVNPIADPLLSWSPRTGACCHNHTGRRPVMVIDGYVKHTGTSVVSADTQGGIV